MAKSSKMSSYPGGQQYDILSSTPNAGNVNQGTLGMPGSHYPPQPTYGGSTAKAGTAQSVNSQAKHVHAVVSQQSGFQRLP